MREEEGGGCCPPLCRRWLLHWWGRDWVYMISTIPHFYLSLQWFPLQSGQGQVHLRLEWLSLLPDAEKLEQVTNTENRKLAGEKYIARSMGAWRDEGLTTTTPHQVLQWNRGVSSHPEPPSAAILVVYLDRAQDLPVSVASEGR